MANTTGIQRRWSRVGAFGGAEYRIETTIDVRGDLPDNGVFLIEIIDVEDATQDILARVTTIADLSEYPPDRVNAVRNGKGFFRTSSYINVYTNLQVAETAVLVLDDYLNRLVSSYATFNTSFDTSGLTGPPTGYALLSFPLVVDAIKDQLTTEYVAARTTATSTQIEVTAKEVECDATISAISARASELTALQATADTLTGVVDQLTVSIEVFDALFLSGEDFAAKTTAGIAAFEDDKGNSLIDVAALSRAYFDDAVDSGDDGIVTNQLAVFNSSVASGRSELVILGVRTAAVAAAQAVVEAQVIVKQAELTDAQDAATTCATEKLVLDAALVRANIEEADAKQALTDVCPDFDFTSV